MHTNTAGGCCQGLSLSLPHREVVLAFNWSLLVNAVSAGVWCVVLEHNRFPLPPSMGLRRQRGPMGALLRVRKGGSPTPYKHVWSSSAESWIWKSKTSNTPSFLHWCLISSCPSQHCSWTADRVGVSLAMNFFLKQRMWITAGVLHFR